jgi:hypothetical protein
MNDMPRHERSGVVLTWPGALHQEVRAACQRSVRAAAAVSNVAVE